MIALVCSTMRPGRRACKSGRGCVVMSMFRPLIECTYNHPCLCLFLLDPPQAHILFLGAADPETQCMLHMCVWFGCYTLSCVLCVAVLELSMHSDLLTSHPAQTYGHAGPCVKKLDKCPHQAHNKCSQISSQPDGMDFFFTDRSHAIRFMTFLRGVVPIRWVRGALRVCVCETRGVL